MTTPNRRGESRYVHHVPLRLLCEGKSHFGVTEDISNGGMRVRTEAYPRLRGLGSRPRFSFIHAPAKAATSL